MVSLGIENEAVDAASIEVSRILRHVKTDRLDGERLLVKLMRYHTGERGGWSVVRVPSPEEEDARHLHRELGRLKRERRAHRLRIQSLLVTQGVRLTVKTAIRLRLGGLSLWDGHSLPLELKAELERETERLALVERQIGALEAPDALCRRRRTHATYRHRCPGAQIVDRAVALPRGRRHARGRTGV